MTEAPNLLAAVRAALIPALVAAGAVGARDALRTLHDNTYAQLSRHFWLYVATPILAVTALAIPTALLVGVVGLAIGLSMRWIAAGTAAVLIGTAAGADAVTWLRSVRAAMRNARVGEWPELHTTLLTASVLLLASSVATAGIALIMANVGERATIVAAGIVALNAALLCPVVLFVVRDLGLWKVGRHDARVGDPDESLGTVTVSDSGKGILLDKRPPVIPISIDTLRADRVGAYGSRLGLTPHLDRLASEGVVCETAIASSSWTLPSIASFLTGLNPSRHGAGPPLNGFDLMARAPLRQGTWTLAQGLKAAGYEAHAVVSNPYLAVQYGLSEGFDSYENVSIESEALLALRSTTAGRLLAPLLRDRIGDSGAILRPAVRQVPTGWMQIAPRFTRG